MTVFEIPIPQSDGTPFQFSTVLDGVTYRFKFKFSWREQRWYFSFYDADRSPIFQELPCVVQYSLLSRVTDSRKPAGKLYLIDSSGAGSEPGQRELGERVKLYYDDEQ